jgi:hypothetical protein
MGGRRISFQRSDLRSIRINAAGKDAARKRGINAMLNNQVEIESSTGSVALVVGDPDLLVDELNDTST